MKQPNTTLCNGTPQERLVIRDFCYVSAANFFLFLSFYALMPLLPFYLYERLGVGGAMVGGVLSSYMVACIGVRPVAGFLLDTFRRRPLYLLAYFLFAVLFGGYAVAASVAAFVLVRIGHGLAFGLGTVSGSTLVSQIVPRSSLGEGLGLYGLANTLAMCLGPMLGLAAYRRFSFDTLFIGIALAAGCGLLAAAQVRIPPRKQGAESAQGAAHRLTPDAFFVREGLWASLTQLLVYAPYGATTAYVAVYANGTGRQNPTGPKSSNAFTCRSGFYALLLLYLGPARRRGRGTACEPHGKGDPTKACQQRSRQGGSPKKKNTRT